MSLRYRFILLVFLLQGVFFAGAAEAESFALGDQLFKLTATDAAAGDYFGASVAISGNTAIVGAYFDDDGGSSSGSAYLFDVTTGNQFFKLTATDAAAGDVFGFSVAISGSAALVGAQSDDDGGSSSGSAYLFDVTTGNQLFKLTATDAAAGDRFGHSVAICGNTAIVGADSDDDGGPGSGSAYLFDVITGNQLFKLTATDAAAGDLFGHSVAISGNTAIVGAINNDDGGSNSGSAYLFDVTTGNQLFKLTATDAAQDDQFGLSVAITGSTAVVSAIGDDDAGSNSGSAYLFNVTTGNQLFKLTATDAAEGDKFGGSAAISGNTALVGAFWDDDAGSDSGSAYLFDATPSTLGVPVGPGFTFSTLPNPFRFMTSITFALKEAGLTQVTVFDIQGRRVKTLIDGTQPAGSRTINWDGSTDSGLSVSPGVYFVKVETGNAVRAQKVVFKP